METRADDRGERLKAAAEKQFGPGGLGFLESYGRLICGMLGMMLLFLPLDDGTRDAVEAWENEGGAP